MEAGQENFDFPHLLLVQKGNPEVLDSWAEPAARSSCMYATTTPQFPDPATATSSGSQEVFPRLGQAQHAMNVQSRDAGAAVSCPGDPAPPRPLLGAEQSGESDSSPATDTDFNSPDSWTSDINQADPATWFENVFKLASGTSPDNTEMVSNSPEDQKKFAPTWDENMFEFARTSSEASEVSISPQDQEKFADTWADHIHDLTTNPSCDDGNSAVEDKKSLVVAENKAANNTEPEVSVNTKKKMKRTIFSDKQLNALFRRFNQQKYLTPVEMQSLAKDVKLTYKQVKTWFQNQRMKLRRCEKDTWRYPSNTTPGPMFTDNMSHMPAEVMGNPFIRNPTQNLAFYHAAVHNAAGPAAYSPWLSSSMPAAVGNNHQMAGWCWQP